MALSPTARQVMLEAFIADARWASIHTDLPGDSGLHEVSGGLYQRLLIPWGSVMLDGTVTSTDDLLFNIPADTSIGYGGYWTEEVGGVWMGWRPLLNPETFVGAGTHRVPSGSLVESLT